jgi:hypothetical protein
MHELQQNWKGVLRVNLLGLGPRFIKKELTGRGLLKGENHWFILWRFPLLSDTKNAVTAYQKSFLRQC